MKKMKTFTEGDIYCCGKLESYLSTISRCKTMFDPATWDYIIYINESENTIIEISFDFNDLTKKQEVTAKRKLKLTHSKNYNPIMEGGPVCPFWKIKEETNHE